MNETELARSCSRKNISTRNADSQLWRFKAAQDRRTPKPVGLRTGIGFRDSVLECGRPLPLWKIVAPRPFPRREFQSTATASGRGLRSEVNRRNRPNFQPTTWLPKPPSPPAIQNQGCCTPQCPGQTHPKSGDCAARRPHAFRRFARSPSATFRSGRPS